MDSDRFCSKCGHKIPWGQNDCPFCPGQGGFLWTPRRDTFLLVTLAILVVLFLVTTFAVRVYKDVQKGYAQEWYLRGENDLRMGRSKAALIDFRTALSYSHGNDEYELRLAQALMMPGVGGGTGLEARTYLQNLLEHDPGNAPVNLELARIAAREHAISDAARYYHGAIYGDWYAVDPAAQRRAARMEFIDFLMQSGQKDAARSELIALAADLPPDPILQTRVGVMLLQVKGYSDASQLFQRALSEQPNLPAALAGAGEVHFLEGDYLRAERYLSRALDQNPDLTDVGPMLDTTRMVLNNDPFNRRLSNREKERRAEADFDAAMARLKVCGAQHGIDVTSAGSDPLQLLYAKVSQSPPLAKPLDPSREAEDLSQVMDSVFEIEQTTAHSCGDPHGLDAALLLLSREQEGARP